MAGKNVSQLTPVDSLTGTELMYVSQSGVDKSATPADIAALNSPGTTGQIAVFTDTNVIGGTDEPSTYSLRLGLLTASPSNSLTLASNGVIAWDDGTDTGLINVGTTPVGPDAIGLVDHSGGYTNAADLGAVGAEVRSVYIGTSVITPAIGASASELGTWPETNAVGALANNGSGTLTWTGFINGSGDDGQVGYWDSGGLLGSDKVTISADGLSVTDGGAVDTLGFPLVVGMTAGETNSALFYNADETGNADLIQLVFSSAESDSIRAYGTFEFQNAGDGDATKAWFGLNFTNAGTVDLFKLDSNARFFSTPVTLASLGTASAAGAGARAFITDGLTLGTWGATAADGGSVVKPVWSNGTNWLNG